MIKQNVFLVLGILAIGLPAVDAQEEKKPTTSTVVIPLGKKAELTAGDVQSSLNSVIHPDLVELQKRKLHLEIELAEAQLELIRKQTSEEEELRNLQLQKARLELEMVGLAANKLRQADELNRPNLEKTNSGASATEPAANEPPRRATVYKGTIPLVRPQDEKYASWVQAVTAIETGLRERRVAFEARVEETKELRNRYERLVSEQPVVEDRLKKAKEEMRTTDNPAKMSEIVYELTAQAEKISVEIETLKKEIRFAEVKDRMSERAVEQIDRVFKITEALATELKSIGVTDGTVLGRNEPERQP